MRHYAGVVLLALFAAACKTTAPVTVQQTPAQPIILTLGSKPFTTDDFFQSFTKNQLSADSSNRTDVNGYFTLYTNLKLKVLAAEAEGRDTTEAFREEMATYRKQLAQAYLTDKPLIESLAAEAYQRMQEEVSVAHILIPVAEYALPADTLAAYKQAQAIRRQATAGTDFTKLALDNSKDATTAQNGGDLGYITAFSLLYPLETAAYTTPVGGISQPARTRFGYHVIKVNGRRPSRGRVRAAHILVRQSADASGEQVARQRIEAAYTRLQKGEAFEAVCRDMSDDETSRTRGGVLPPFEPGRWVTAFEDAAFALTNPGDYSKPVRTDYGWHIIKLIEHRPLESYAAMAPSLRQRVTTDSRAELVRQATIQRLKNTYPVQENTSVLESALAKADSSLLRGQWRYTTPLDQSLQNKPLVTISAKPYTVNQFFDYVSQRQRPQRNPALASATNVSASQTLEGAPSIAMHRLFNQFVGDQLLATEEAGLDKKFPEFRALMNEIRDGVLLSQVMEENVWERSMADSTGQRQYYDQHKAEYQFSERAVATILTAPTDSLLRQATSVFAGKPPYQLRRSAALLSFDRNQTDLTPQQRESLVDLLAVLGQNPGYVVEVSGSHDPAERDSVSAGRIRNVVSYLQKNGIPLVRIMEKDYQGSRPGVRGNAQRNVTFQYFSKAREDVVKVINGKRPASAGLTITEGVFAEGDNPDIDSVDPWKVGTTTRHKDGKAVAIIISRIEPARAKTFAEARGSVINAYQALLEKQWMAQLRQTYPVKVNEAEMQKLTK